MEKRAAFNWGFGIGNVTTFGLKFSIKLPDSKLGAGAKAKKYF
jgi:hypothetical protein